MGINKTLPTAAIERIKELGYRVRLARTRRSMSIAEVAAKAGINRNTLNALELGKHGVAMGAYVTVLWAVGLDSPLPGGAPPPALTPGMRRAAWPGPPRVRKSRKSKDEYDF